IIVPTYNRANYLKECLDSLITQSRPALEIIVIDDGSEDNTANIVKEYGDKVRYVHKSNGGKPSAVNYGLSIAKGNLIWLFDDDDAALPDAIETRLAVLANKPYAGFVYSPHYIGSNDKHGKLKKDKLYQPYNYADSEFLFELLKGCFFHLASSIVRIEAYQLVGGFDTDLLSSEDYDMQIRLARLFPAAYSKAPSFIFRQHTGLRGAAGIRYSSNDRTSVFRKYDQLVGKKIRSNFSIGEFLIPPSSETITTVQQHRDALLARMVIMASKGCITEMFDDLLSALALIDNSSEPSINELLSTAITTGYAYEAIKADWPSFKCRLRDLNNNPYGKQAKIALAKGFFRLAKSYPGNIFDRTTKLRYAFTTVLS
ncbi:glycosyltransferase, partial [Pseudomonadota bacterium]